MRALPTAFVFALALSNVLPAQERRLGALDFPNSGAAEAQTPFIRGVLLLHSFEFDDAAAEFRAAQEADPDFALAYWGEAMTYNHPLWQEQDRDAARSVMDRYRAAGGVPHTEREAMYLEALGELYDRGTKADRDRRYMDSMRRLHKAYPEDLEARAFYALSILGSTDGVRDFATYMRAAAVAQPVFDANPSHPGAVHYIIHSFDDPVHAPLGLPAARAYSEIAPDAGHAQHMTSHIFVAMGMWDDVVSANIRARDVQNGRRAELGMRPNVCGHYTSWLHYGYLMQGRPADAARGMEECMDRIRDHPNDSERSYFTGMRARHVLDLEDWSAADRWTADFSDRPFLQARLDFVTAYAAIQTGERARAEAIMARMNEMLGQEPEYPRARIMLMELDALTALEAGQNERAVTLLREASALEASLPFEFGPPASLKPPHELLGEVLLRIGRAEEAVETFRESLRFTPERTLSLMGLAVAAGETGMERLAADADARLARIWSAAEPSFRDRIGR